MKESKQKEVFRVWQKYPAFKCLQYSSIVTSFANWSSFIAMLVLLHQITNSGFALGTLWAVSGLAPLLFSMIVGVWVDRLEMQKWVVINEILRAICYLGFIIVPLLPETLAVTLFMILRFVTGIMTSYNSAAKQAVTPDLVSAEDLVVANSLSYTINSTVRLVGASLGGLLITLVGQDVNWIITAVSFLISAWLNSRHKWTTTKKVKLNKNFREELTTGLKVSFGNKWITLVLFASLSMGLLIGSYNLAIEEYVTDTYKMASWGIGALYVAEGLISALLGLWMANRKFFFKKISRYGTMYALVGVSWILFGFSRNLLEGAASLILFAIFCAFTAPYERLTMQKEVPDQTRGRVFGLWGTIQLSAMQVGAFLTGIIISSLGLTYVPIVIGGIQLIFGLAFTLLTSRNAERDMNQLKTKSI